MKETEGVGSSNNIYKKLEAFIRKYYTNELIRGIVLFIGLGLCYFLFTLFVEYFLWLKPTGRSMLFWIFVGVESFLFARFILFPIFKLFRLQKGIDYDQASKIIGTHFDEVRDSLTNLLQLVDSGKEQGQSELLMASIDQRANALQPVPFSKAIDFSSNRKYLPFALVPILVFISFYLSGNNAVISQSLNRVVHYNDSFIPPAPFKFVLLNRNLHSEQSKDFMFKIKAEGNVVPENAMIYINGESYFMENLKAGEFQFKIVRPRSDVVFHVESNGVSSVDYTLKVIAVPTISNFEVKLDYPSYLKRVAEVVYGTGNVVIPEGTDVTWLIQTVATEEIEWVSQAVHFQFVKTLNNFLLSKNVVQNTEYQIVTSNKAVIKYETLEYQLTVIRDQLPTISASNAPDSLNVDKSYVLGQIADDYGLSKLQVVYYPKSKPDLSKRKSIVIKPSGYQQFLYSFPGLLLVEQGVSYEYYFEVFDNDSRNGYKSARSSVFSNRISTDEENKNELLQQQNENINSLDKSIRDQDKQLLTLDKLQKTGKEKKQLGFKDQQNVKDFIEQQQKQDDMMKEFAKKMKDNLEQLKTPPKDKLKEELKDRLVKADDDLKKNQELLDQLKELNEKIKDEELHNKLDQFKQKSKNQIKNLEQLVELTKRYYVEKKAEQMADKLDALSQTQDKLADDEKENSSEKQDQVNSTFERIREELKQLNNDNEKLKSPIDLPKDIATEKSIADDLKNASEELEKDNKGKAKPSQKNAASKMKEMAKKIGKSMQGSEKAQMEEDVKMLRQILDNLLAFSLSQEYVMVQFSDLKKGSPAFNKYIKQQQDLKQQFKHVDDSLFAISLRNPKIAEDITKEIGNVQYNLDKSVVSLSEAQIPKGLSYQQYTIASANKLGDFLSETLNNMQMSLAGIGASKPKPGSGDGMQLPDIIKKQEGLGDKMKEGMYKGPMSGDGKDGKSGQGEKKGEDGLQGSGMGEGDAEALLEIYKEQKQLREALENELRKQGLSGSGQNALDQMKQIEKQLLNKGFKNETLQKILNVKQELLKLNTAVQQQREERERESESNIKEFNNESKPLPEALLDYLNSIEILNRQSLPLRSNYSRKVQDYFNKK